MVARPRNRPAPFELHFLPAAALPDMLPRTCLDHRHPVSSWILVSSRILAALRFASEMPSPAIGYALLKDCHALRGSQDESRSSA